MCRKCPQGRYKVLPNIKQVDVARVCSGAFVLGFWGVLGWDVFKGSTFPWGDGDGRGSRAIPEPSQCHPYLAITAHWITTEGGLLSMKVSLIAFHYVFPCFTHW